MDNLEGAMSVMPDHVARGFTEREPGQRMYSVTLCVAPGWLCNTLQRYTTTTMNFKVMLLRRKSGANLV